MRERKWLVERLYVCKRHNRNNKSELEASIVSEYNWIGGHQSYVNISVKLCVDKNYYTSWSCATKETVRTQVMIEKAAQWSNWITLIALKDIASWIFEQNPKRRRGWIKLLLANDSLKQNLTLEFLSHDFFHFALLYQSFDGKCNMKKSH